jgi:hypothetical protein
MPETKGFHAQKRTEIAKILIFKAREGQMIFL